MICHDILRESTSRFVQLAAAIALSHHERHDGLGYPNGLAGNAIPIGARIVAIANVFDAMCSPRPWRDALPVSEAVEHIRTHSGTRFHPDCVAAFNRGLARILEIQRAFAGPPAVAAPAGA